MAKDSSRASSTFATRCFSPMPVRTHWTINPKKWFGTNSSGSKSNSLPRVKHRGTVASTTSSISSVPRLLNGPNQIPMIPVSVSTELYQERRHNYLTANATPIRQFQLPAFSARRDHGSALFPSSSSVWNQNPLCLPKHTEPTIRKHRRGGTDGLLIDTTTRWPVPIDSKTIYDLPPHPRSIEKKAEHFQSNASRQGLIDFPRRSFHPNDDVSSSLSSVSSTSSFMEERDYASTSGVYTDDRQFIESKETLELRSATSIGDSQATFQKTHARPIIHHYRRPVSVFDNDDEDRRRQTSIQQANRSCSAEDILQATPTKKNGRSAEKPLSIPRASTMALERVGFVRVSNDTYRLTMDKSEELFHRRKHSVDSLVEYSDVEENDADDENDDEEDALPPAHDEESYADIPRTSSTEQLNIFIQEDLRLRVHQCLRPMIDSIGKTRLPKTQQIRFKRSHNEPTSIRAEDIAEKLYSSVNYPNYSQFQRCC